MSASVGSAADLPRDIVQRIGGSLDLRCRARASCACKQWLAALPSAPIHRLTVGPDDPPGLWTWLCTHRPAIKALEVASGLWYRPRDQESVALKSVAFKALLSACLYDTKSLTYDYGAVPLGKVLPDISSTAPRLEVLLAHIGGSEVTTWDKFATSLGQLAALKRLELQIWPTYWAEDRQEFCLPRLAHVSALRLIMHDLWGRQPRKLKGGQLPSLRQLSVKTGAGPMALSAETPGFPQLRELDLSLEDTEVVTLDFGCMPVLESMKLACPVREVNGLESSACASTRLSVLRLSYVNEDKSGPWLSGLLQALPQSLRALKLWGCWGQGVRDALSQAMQLQVLEVWYEGGDTHWYPPPTAPLWEGLLALQVNHCSKLGAMVQKLPQDLCTASCLEILQLGAVYLHPADMDSIQHMPALKKLYLEPRPSDFDLECERYEPVAAELSRAVAHAAVYREWLGSNRHDFLMHALDALG